MKGDLRCIEGRLFRHDPQWDDPDLETDVGQCPDCSGDGCGDDGEPVSKAGRNSYWMTGSAGATPMTADPRTLGEPDDYDDNPTPICPATGTYCSGEFCDEYGCAKQAGFWDDEDDY